MLPLLIMIVLSILGVVFLIMNIVEAESCTDSQQITRKTIPSVGLFFLFVFAIIGASSVYNKKIGKSNPTQTYEVVTDTLYRLKH